METEQVHFLLNCAIHGTALVLNMGLLYVVYRCSSAHLRGYANVIRLTCVNDILLSAVCLVSQMACVTNEKHIYAVVNWPFSGRWMEADRAVATLFSTVQVMNTAFVVVPFLFRYLKLCRGVISSNRLLFKLSIPPMLATCFFAFIFYAMWPPCDDSQEAIETFKQAGWTLKSNEQFVFDANMDDAATKSGLGLTFANMFVVYVIVAFTQSKVMRRLKYHEVEMRGSTRKMHSDVNKALIAVAICPLIATILPMMFSMSCLALRLDIGVLAPLLTVINTSVALANPITTICFVRPYRATLANLFKQRTLVGSKTISFISDTRRTQIVQRSRAQ